MDTLLLQGQCKHISAHRVAANVQTRMGPTTEIVHETFLCRCIVAAGTGRGVFDGSVRVERQAQKTDAGQLSRNLLLVPRATVNVKPNLQIVADDVKCTHGCAVSDLEEDQLFYFRQVHALPHTCQPPHPELEQTAWRHFPICLLP